MRNGHILSLVAALLALASARGQTTYYVNGSCGNDGWSGLSPVCQAPDGPKQTIFAGLQVVTTGDTVIVADGTYSGPMNTQLFFGGEDVTLRSANGPANCIIDCQHLCRAFHFVFGESQDAVLDGFSIINGVDDENNGGGAILCMGASPTIRNCRFVGNESVNSGYGENRGGGAILCDGGAARILNSTFLENGSHFEGGAIASTYTSGAVLVEHCTFSGNFEGAGVVVVYGTVEHCVFTDNGPLVDFGVVCAMGGTVRNCLIANNLNDAVFVLAGQQTIENCTIAYNDGATFHLYHSIFTTLNVRNTIIWGDAYTVIPIAASFTFCDIQGGWSGTGNINAPPLFVSGPLGDYYLSQTAAGQPLNSPCVDSGSDTAASLGLHLRTTRTDRWGDTGIVDMGYHYPDAIPPPCVYPTENALPADDDDAWALGQAVAIDGDRAVVCQMNWSAFVYRLRDYRWQVESEIPMPRYIDFGWSVALEGDKLLIGAPWADGAVYVYRFNDGGTPGDPNDDGWMQQTVLVAADAVHSPAYQFGYAVALHGDTAAITTLTYDSEHGGTYVFICDDNGTPDYPLDDVWSQVARLTSYGQWWSRPGASVAMDSETIVTGALDYDPNGVLPDVGAVYVYERPPGGWTDMPPVARLSASAPAMFDYLGCSVGITGEWIAAGVLWRDTPITDAGAVYLYHRSGPTWTDMTETTQLVAPDGATEDRFGYPLALEGDRLIAGAWSRDGAEVNAGAVYAFQLRNSVWSHQATVIAADEMPDGSFGYSVALDGSVALVGAPGHVPHGGAYWFRMADCDLNDITDVCDVMQGAPDCNHNGIPDDCDLSDGFAPDCNSNSLPDECDLDAGTSEDCNLNRVPDECDIAGGQSADCNSNGRPDLCDVEVYQTSPDCNGNLIPDECDVASGQSADCNGNAVPDECDLWAGTSPDCNNNWVPDECDIASGASQDCQPDGIPDECQLSGNDCNTNGVPDECDIAGGSEDCQPDGIPDECQLSGNDCNTNGVPDECDVSGGTSQDCNTNGNPDECDLAGGTSLDCQPNGIPDECETDCNTNDVPDDCDLVAGTSEDCNTNGVPDECDIAGGGSEDVNENGIPDECEDCAGPLGDGDFNGDDYIDLLDFAALEGCWAGPGLAVDPNCAAFDLNGDCDADLADAADFQAGFTGPGIEPPEGLIGYWPMNEGSGTVVHDASEHGLDGTNYGADWVSGCFLAGLSFTGSDEVELPSTFDAQIYDEFTIACWVRRNGSTQPGYVFDGRNWNVNAGFILYVYPGGEVFLSLYRPGGTTSVTGSIPVPIGLCSHIVGIFDGPADQLRLYVDGQPDNTAPVTHGYYRCAEWATIGNNRFLGNDRPFNGVIDEMRLYDNALSPGQVQYLYQSLP